MPSITKKRYEELLNIEKGADGVKRTMQEIRNTMEVYDRKIGVTCQGMDILAFVSILLGRLQQAERVIERLTEPQK